MPRLPNVEAANGRQEQAPDAQVGSRQCRGKAALLAWWDPDHPVAGSLKEARIYHRYFQGQTCNEASADELDDGVRYVDGRHLSLAGA